MKLGEVNVPNKTQIIEVEKQYTMTLNHSIKAKWYYGDDELLISFHCRQ